MMIALLTGLAMMHDTMQVNAVLGVMLAAFDSFWIAVVIIIGSAIYNWLQKKKEANGEQAAPPRDSSRPGATPPRTSTHTPRPSQPVSWEEELRRLLEGDAPVAPPPPPIVVVERKPAAPPPLPPKPKVQPIIEIVPPRPSRPLATLT